MNDIEIMLGENGILAISGLFVTAVIFYVIYILAMLVLVGGGIAGMSHMFTKAGEKPWKAIIPFYYMYVLFDISWKKRNFWFWLVGEVLLVIGVGPLQWMVFDNGIDEVGVIFSVMAIAGVVLTVVFQARLSLKIARTFGKGGGYAWGLFFFSDIFYMILGFGSAQYLGSNQPSLKLRQNQYEYIQQEMELPKVES